MRCPSCQNENPGVARFCMYCGGPLAAAATPRAVPVRKLGSYTPAHLVRKILTTRSALEGERKQVTVLFADVKGSVALSEQTDAEQWHGILDRFFQILALGIHRFEGTINQFTGDGIMALFGAPIAHEDHAQRACYAALHLQQALRKYADELRRHHGLNFGVRMGLNSGEVVVGRIGDDLRMDYTAQGQTVGLAARVQQVAASDRIYLAPQTAALVRGYFDLEELGNFDLKGIEGAVSLNELVGIGALRSRLELSRSRGFSRFLGRDDEMQVLDQALERALAGHAQLVSFVGEAGVGKSRLCYEFLEHCEARGIPCTRTHGVAHGRNIPLLPILDLYREALGVSESDSPQEAREKIAGRVVLLDETLAEYLPLVFDFLGVPDPERPAPALSPEARQRRLIDFDVGYSMARSRREPMVTLYEDLQWFDEASLDWLAALVERAAESRTLVVVNFRPEFVPQWKGEEFHPIRRIAPLGEETASLLLDFLLGGNAALAPLKRKILSVTLGNPFFIEEVVRALAEADRIVGSAGDYRLVGRLPQVQIPDSVQSLLAARIDQLGEREKSLLQTVSVIGRRVSRNLLEAVTGEIGEELDALLAELLRREFLLEHTLYPEAVYQLNHPLTREVAYLTQLASRRAQIHESVARAIESLNADRLDERAALLAHHWEQAGNALEAAHWHDRAALWMSAQNLAEAIRHWRSSRRMLLPIEAEKGQDEAAIDLGLRVRLGLLDVGGRTGLSRNEAGELIAEGRALAERTGDRSRLCELLVSFGACCIFSADFDRGLAALREAEAVAQEIGSRELLLTARGVGAWSLFARGQLPAALRLNRRALDALAGGDQALTPILGASARAALLSMRAGILTFLGETKAAEELAAQVWELDEDVERSEWIAGVLGMQSMWELDRGRYDAALAFAQRAVAIGEASNNANVQIHGLRGRCRAHAARGEWREAIEAGERSLEVLRDTGILQAEIPALCALTRAHLAAGNLARALACAREAIELAPDRDFLHSIDAQLVLARSLARMNGDAVHEEIEVALARASEGVEESGARFFEAEIHEQAAELALLRGQLDIARREFVRARDEYGVRGATAPEAVVAKRLESL